MIFFFKDFIIYCGWYVILKYLCDKVGVLVIKVVNFLSFVLGNSSLENVYEFISFLLVGDWGVKGGFRRVYL